MAYNHMTSSCGLIYTVATKPFGHFWTCLDILLQINFAFINCTYTVYEANLSKYFLEPLFKFLPKNCNRIEIYWKYKNQLHILCTSKFLVPVRFMLINNAYLIEK